MYEDFIAERLATLRNQKNVSAREMSLAIGQNSSYINRIENKIAQPSMQCFFYICEYLGVTPREFFDPANVYPEQIGALIPTLLELDSEQLDIIHAVAKGLAKKNGEIS